jgi:hypothetical protein
MVAPAGNLSAPAATDDTAKRDLLRGFYTKPSFGVHIATSVTIKYTSADATQLTSG